MQSRKASRLIQSITPEIRGPQSVLPLCRGEKKCIGTAMPYAKKKKRAAKEGVGVSERADSSRPGLSHCSSSSLKRLPLC